MVVQMLCATGGEKRSGRRPRRRFQVLREGLTDRVMYIQG